VNGSTEHGAGGVLDLEAVTSLLRTHLGPDARCDAVERATSGNSQETWLLSIGGVASPRSLVLRRTAVAGTLEWCDRGAEVAVLRAVRAAGLPVPKVWWWEPDGSSLDRAYVVMDRADGAAPDLRDRGVCGELAADLGRRLAQLHGAAVAPAVIDRPASTHDADVAQLDAWTRRARDSGVAPAITAALCGWLARHVRHDDTAPVLVWGDPGPHNVLTDPAGRITALLDWELAHFGHPLEDLGGARWACLGHLDRELLTSAYEHEGGRTIDRDALAWYEVLACVSRSVMLFDGVRSAIDGRSHDPNVVGLGVALVAANMLRAASIAWGVDHATVDASDGVPSALRPTPVERDRIIARFLGDVAADVHIGRVRRALKVAAAHLSVGAVDDEGGSDAADVWSWFDRERLGQASADDRRRLVAGMVAERRRHAALFDLYGATTAVDDVAGDAPG
jgi:aminoglycoside phosphotransferase (APT) family kinase protein